MASLLPQSSNEEGGGGEGGRRVLWLRAVKPFQHPSAPRIIMIFHGKPAAPNFQKEEEKGGGGLWLCAVKDLALEASRMRSQLSPCPMTTLDVHAVLVTGKLCIAGLL